MAGGPRKSKEPKPVSEGKENEDVDVGRVADSPLQDETPAQPPKRGAKRISDIGITDVGNPEMGDMQSLFTSFGADVSKTLESKRKRLESFTQSTLKISNKKVDDMWQAQQAQRSKLAEEYKKQVGGVLSQWESDVQKGKEAEEKLQSMFKQQQKIFQQQRIVQSQRLGTIKELHEQYMKGTEELDRCHQEQQVGMQEELKKEIALLQKKILMDSQQEEMSHVRRSLQSMLAQV